MEKFVVSARKYRPDNFKSVVGQEHITSTLVNAIARNQLSHAYLFCGPRGVGKTTCARIIAKAINCLNPKPNHEACGECDSCRAFSENSSFNIYELDAASNNSVDNIRSLIEQVRIPPQVGKYSIYIIDEVHMLTTAAFNAFLKTLEEPPSYVIFILATTEKHKILPTILSRCQIYEFKHISVEDVVGYLKYISSQEGVTYDEESLYIISQKADGCMRDALSMYDKVVTFCDSKLTMANVSSALNILDYDTYFSFADMLCKSDYQSALLLLDDVLKRGFDSTTFLSGLSRHFRDLLVARSSSTLPLLAVTGTLAARYSKQASELSVSFIFGVIDIINSAENNIKFSLNQRLVAELAIMKMCNITAPPAQITNEVPQVPKVSKPTETVVEKPIIAEPEKQVTQQTTEPSEPKEPKEQPTETEQQTEQITKAPKAQGKTSLGLPRLTAMTTPSADVQSVDNIEQEHIDITNYEIKEQDIKKVIDGCYLFAEKIQQRNPRIAIAFNSARVEGGKLYIPVPNKILADEINIKKSQTMVPLSRYAGVNIYDFVVLVEQAPIEGKKILISNEDKYKYLLNENPELHTLAEKIDLNFS